MSNSKYSHSYYIFLTMLFGFLPSQIWSQQAGLVIEKGNGVQNNQGGMMILGNLQSTHLAFDSDDIQRKMSATNYGTLYLNYYGGDVSLGAGALCLDRANERIGISTCAPSQKIDIYAGDSTFNDGIRTTYQSGNGAALLANNANIGGWFVTDGATDWAPIWSHSFNILSDQAVKKNINPISEENCHSFLKYFDRLESVSFQYAQEREQRAPHVCILAHTAPPEMLSQVSKNPVGGDEKVLGVNLADWVGLNTVVIKNLLKEIKQIRSELNNLQQRED